MPDIEIKCASCSASTTVSEYADAESIVCGKCGAKLSKPKASLHLKQRPTVRRQEVTHTQVPVPPAPPKVLLNGATNAAIDTVQTNAKPVDQVRKAKPTQLIISWILFVALALVMGWLRYGNALPTAGLEKFTQYGPFAMITIHLTIFILVCKESIFTGILCLIVPFYGLYYVFFASDAFILRAILAGALVGIGQDSFIFFKDLIITGFEVANQWIRHGALH